MRYGIRVSIVAGVIAFSSPQMARAGENCGDPGRPDAKPIQIATDNTTALRGLSVALAYGLNPQSFPEEQISASGGKCRRGAFLAGETKYDFFGNGHLPVRWARSPKLGDGIVYLALLPKPGPALTAYERNPNVPVKFGKDEFMYVLAITDGSARLIYRFYDGLPVDDVLAKDMCKAASGQLPR